ncbi:transmembrane protein 45b [Plakobranchus ocellatus]|uniref:Transmembrane protein 45b n=1 Tax=Plakobranchus ocellatus TaxID=259542 RepID=A0AAV4DDP8_9GAST|nr:transmembrane protein 45b [Plakobranchus ocellatus]
MESQSHMDLTSPPGVSVDGNTTVAPLNETSRMVKEGISGHIVASSVWFFVGFMYILSALRRFYVRQQTDQKFVSSVEFPLDFLSGRFRNFPFIAVFKIVGASVYLSIEIIATIVREPGCIETPVWQHETMATIFLMSGVVDMITLKTEGLNILPDGTDYLVFSLTFGIQVLQFYFHLEGRPPLGARLHALQALLAAMCTLALLMEAKYRSHVMMPVIRGYCIMAQGTWMMNLMFILYHPHSREQTWDLYAHESVDLVSLMFVYHLIMDMLLVLVVNLLFVRAYSRPRCSYKFVPQTDSYDYNGKRQVLAMEKLTR